MVIYSTVQFERGESRIVTIVNFIWVLFKTLGKFALTVVTLIVLATVSVNVFAILSTHSQVIQVQEVDQAVSADVPILVLGASVINNEYPSQILANRLDKAYEIHLANPENPLIMTGDHFDQYYNEVSAMKNYLVDKGVPSDQIYLDHAGLSTYASLYRLKEVVGEDQVIIVTQGYHLSRALMIANGLGVEAVGVPSDEIKSTRLEREAREVLARCKDFLVLYLSYDGEQPDEDFGFSLGDGGDSTDVKEEL